MPVQPDILGITEAHGEVITPNGYRIAWDTEALAKSICPDCGSMVVVSSPRWERTPGYAVSLDSQVTWHP